MGRTRIPKDPNNHRWVRDTTTFGQRILRSHGWTPGSYLGAVDAPHSSLHTAANASYVRVMMKEDQGGLGWKAGGGDDSRIAGLDEVRDIFARLNGKQETEAERLERERRKAMVYIGQRVGGVTFVRGGLLVQDDLEVMTDDGVRTPVETGEAIEEYEAREDAKEGKAAKKRKAVDEDEDDKAMRKKRRKEEKAEKKRRKEERKKLKEASVSLGLETETEIAAMEASNSILRSTLEASSTAGDSSEESKPRKRSKKSPRGVLNSTTLDPVASVSVKKRPKKDRKSKSSTPSLETSIHAITASADEAQTFTGSEPAAGLERHEALVKKAKEKKEKQSKKSKSKHLKEGSRSSTASQIPTPIATGTCTPSDNPSRTSTPLMGRHIHHARRVAAKQAAILDPAALKGILAI